MKFTIFVLAGVVLTATIVSADTVTLSSGATAYSFGEFNPSQTSPTANTSTTLTSGSPFWNNYSTDTPGMYSLPCSGAQCTSHDMNVGYMLSNTGGFSGDNVFGGTDSVSTTYTNSDGSDPSSFTFTPNPSQTYDVTMLGAYSGNSNSDSWGTQFGIYYVVDDVVMYDQLYGPGANGYSDTVPIDISNIQDGGVSFGFYAKVCNFDSTTGQCGYTTYFSGGGNSGYVVNNAAAYYDAGAYNHFALFGLSSSAQDFVVAFKDGPVAPEGLGDFNDVVVEFADPSFQLVMPEPATMGFVGLGLVLLGIKRRRKSLK